MERHLIHIDRKNIFKITLLPKALYRINAIPIKIPMAFFTELEQIIIKFAWKNKRPQIAKTILRKKNKAKGNMFPDLKLNYKARIISMVLAQNWKHRSMGQNKRSKMNIYIYGQLIYDIGGKNQQNKKATF